MVLAFLLAQHAQGRQAEKAGACLPAIYPHGEPPERRPSKARGRQRCQNTPGRDYYCRRLEGHDGECALYMYEVVESPRCPYRHIVEGWQCWRHMGHDDACEPSAAPVVAPTPVETCRECNGEGSYERRWADGGLDAGTCLTCRGTGRAAPPVAPPDAETVTVTREQLVRAAHSFCALNCLASRYDAEDSRHHHEPLCMELTALAASPRETGGR